MLSVTLTRRRFLELTALGLASAAAGQTAARPRFDTRGVVLVPDDFSLPDWPERAHRAGLTTLALHHGTSVGSVIRFVRSEAGHSALARVRQLGLQIEYELHAVDLLLPRDVPAKDPTLYRMDEKGERVIEGNLCVHSPAALEIAAERAVKIGRILRPTTGRYFYWGDDLQPWCRCPKCREFSDSEQALLFENALIGALRKEDPLAQLAHLAYLGTLPAPRKVKPAPGVFLEYAPIKRDYDRPYAKQVDGKDGLEHLDANLKVFPVGTAQVLEYWLDVSRFSNWQRPAKKLPWRRDVFLADLETYAARGIRHVTSFAVYMDAEYVELHGEPTSLAEYGAGLK